MKARISTTENETTFLRDIYLRAMFRQCLVFGGFDYAVEWAIAESLRTIHNQINQRCEAALKIEV